MGDCSRTRVLAFVSIALAIACVILVAVLVWRERSRPKDKDTQLKASVVKATYPQFFRTPEEQQIFADRFFNKFYNDRTIVNDTINPAQLEGKQCLFQCGPFNPQRRRRVATQQVFHGCCASSVSFVTPSSHPNVNGQMKTLLQMPGLNQFFTLHTCQSITRCSGCQCSSEDNLYTAVVVKSGVSDPDDIDDTEIDLFLIDGCCKCINT